MTAYQLARRNAAALIQAMDLEQLFGGDEAVEQYSEERLEAAQRKVVAYLLKGLEKKKP